MSIIIRISNKTWRRCLGGALAGCFIGLWAMYGMYLSDPNIVLEYLGSAPMGLLIFIGIDVEEDWKHFVFYSIYYGIAGGIFAFLINEKKWKLLGFCVIALLSINFLLGLYATQQIFQGLESIGKEMQKKGDQ